MTYGYLHISILMSFVLHGYPAVCHSCADYVPLDVSFIQRALSADTVLYGRDITPPTTNCVQTINQTCNRGNITLEVFCVLKKVSNGPEIPQTVDIVELPMSDSMLDCVSTHTVLSNNERDELVVLVRHLTSNVYQWQDIYDGSSVSIVASELDWIDVKRQCALTHWEVIGEGGKCPTIGTDAVIDPCQKGPLCRGDGWNYIEDSCYWISSYNTSYDEALENCHQMNSILVTMHADDGGDEIIDVLPSAIDPELIWWTGGSYYDVTACCIAEGVVDKCLVFCSQIGLTHNIPNDDIINACKYEPSMVHILRCSQGYKPAMECCEAKLLEAKNEPAVLSATDVQCLTFCNFTLADDLETTLKKIPDLSNLQGFLRDCGSSHYLSKFATCWGNLTANREVSDRSWGVEIPAANETINEKIILGQDGLAVTENYLEHRYNFVCEKSPALYPNKWATMMEETTTQNITDLTTDNPNVLIAAIVGSVLGVFSLVVFSIIGSIYIRKRLRKTSSSENVYDDDQGSIYDSIADKDLDPDHSDEVHSTNEHKTNSYLSPIDMIPVDQTGADHDASGDTLENQYINSSSAEQSVKSESSVVEDCTNSTEYLKMVTNDCDSTNDDKDREPAQYSQLADRHEENGDDVEANNFDSVKEPYATLSINNNEISNDMPQRPKTTIDRTNEADLASHPRSVKSMHTDMYQLNDSKTSTNCAEMDFPTYADHPETLECKIDENNNSSSQQPVMVYDNNENQSNEDPEQNDESASGVNGVVDHSRGGTMDNTVAMVCNNESETTSAENKMSNDMPQRPKTTIDLANETTLTSHPRSVKSMHTDMYQLNDSTNSTNCAGLDLPNYPDHPETLETLDCEIDENNNSYNQQPIMMYDNYENQSNENPKQDDESASGVNGVVDHSEDGTMDNTVAMVCNNESETTSAENNVCVHGLWDENANGTVTCSKDHENKPNTLRRPTRSVVILRERNDDISTASPIRSSLA